MIVLRMDPSSARPRGGGGVGARPSFLSRSHGFGQRTRSSHALASRSSRRECAASACPLEAVSELATADIRL